MPTSTMTAPFSLQGIQNIHCFAGGLSDDDHSHLRKIFGDSIIFTVDAEDYNTQEDELLSKVKQIVDDRTVVALFSNHLSHCCALHVVNSMSRTAKKGKPPAAPILIFQHDLNGNLMSIQGFSEEGRHVLWSSTSGYAEGTFASYEEAVLGASAT